MRLFIAVPSGGVVDVRFVHGLLELKLSECPFEVHFAFGSGITNARNVLAKQFLDGKCTDILFIDSDIVFRPVDVSNLWSRKLDVVGGFYPKKQVKLEYVCVPLEGREPAGDDGLMELKRIGTGFLLLNKKVLEAMREKIPDINYLNAANEECCRFFSEDVVDGRYRSEDWYFCDRAREIGFKIFGDTRVVVGHIGTIVWPLEVLA